MNDTNDNLWRAHITRIGPEAPTMFASGVFILFGEPVPDALAEVSIVHDGSGPPNRELRPGDTITVGSATVTIDRVGERANANLAELGHVVVYVDAGDQQLLPGAVHASGGTLAPAVGDHITVNGS